MKQLQSTDRGLNSSDAAARLKQVGPNSLKAARRASALGLLLNQFKSPLVLILIVATIISAFVGEYTDALITFIILMSSALLMHEDIRVTDGIYAPLAGREVQQRIAGLTNTR